MHRLSMKSNKAAGTKWEVDYNSGYGVVTVFNPINAVSAVELMGVCLVCLELFPWP